MEAEGPKRDIYNTPDEACGWLLEQAVKWAVRGGQNSDPNGCWNQQDLLMDWI